MNRLAEDMYRREDRADADEKRGVIESDTQRHLRLLNLSHDQFKKVPYGR